MTKFIAIASGKGGTGKTTVSLNLASALSQYARSVTIVEGNLNTPNIGIYLGSPLLENTIHDVLKGRKKIRDSAYLHPSGFNIIPGSIASDIPQKSELRLFSDYLLELEGTSEIVLIDVGAGIGEDVLEIIKAADETIIVTNPELAAVSDAMKLIKRLREKKQKIMGIILNRARSDAVEMDVKNVETLLEERVIGVIAYDEKMRHAVAIKHPIVFSHPESKAADGFKKLAARLIGEKYVRQSEKQEKKSMFEYVLHQLGLK